MGNKTVLYDVHREFGARIVPFGGWDMPLHYGSQIEEHHRVRRDAGMFDVSHMTVVDLHGAEVRDFLRYLLANDVARLKHQGKALYSCMLNPTGGVIDDLIVYYLHDDWFRMVVNAATTDKDLAWIDAQAGPFAIDIKPRRDLALVAVQGPRARELALPLLPEELQASSGALKPFTAASGNSWFVGRTGYTGEDGFEVMMPAESAADFWRALAERGVSPCGLGARDTLRLEAGMNLYGADMDEDTSPLEAGLGWTVAWDPGTRDFVGRQSLEAMRSAPDNRRFVGLVLVGRGVLRDHLPVYSAGKQVGQITSGGYSPTLERSIALARVDLGLGDSCEVEIRRNKVLAKVVRPPFVRNGKPQIELP